MRIVFAITMGIERPSGQRYYNVARELVGQGHRVRIIALHPDLTSCATSRFLYNGVEIWYVGQMYARKCAGVTQSFSAFQLLWVLVTATWGMFWALWCSPADVYHLGKPHPVNGLAALLAIRLRGKRLYLDCDDEEVGSNRTTNRFQRWVFAFWQWFLPLIVDGVTVNTHFLEQRLAKRGIKNVVYVPNGVDYSLFQRPDSRTIEVLKKSLDLENKYIIAYVGTIAFHSHPVDLLLEAFRQFSPTNPDAMLLIIGGGEDLRILKQWISKHDMSKQIKCLGHIERQSLPLYMALADVTVDPVYDNAVARARSPLKIVESLALGIPVITSDVGDRAEMVGRHGLIVEAGNSLALYYGFEQIYYCRLIPNIRIYDWVTLSYLWLRAYDK